MDVDSGIQVRNHAVYSYEILRRTEIPPEFAAKMVHPSLKTYPFNNAAKKFVYYKTSVSFVANGYSLWPMAMNGLASEHLQVMELDYILEIDVFGAIVGGEWVLNSKFNHPDFFFYPLSQVDPNYVVADDLHYSKVKALLDESIRGFC